MHRTTRWENTKGDNFKRNILNPYTPEHKTKQQKFTKYKQSNKLNSVALVRTRTIPTERPPLSAK
jgi:hypothetical protein